jgi:hypothetical protein
MDLPPPPQVTGDTAPPTQVGQPHNLHSASVSCVLLAEAVCMRAHAPSGYALGTS